MIKVVLDNNNFNLGDKHYVQTKGVATGSRLGKDFACSYMRIWDEQLLDFSQRQLFYKMFIDDGFGIWTGSVESLLEFARHANSINENIKIELRYNTEKIEFLDTLVKLENGHIYTSLYKKPTDKQLYLHNSSSHPPNTKTGLAYGLGLRLRRICERDVDYQKHRTDLKQQLRKRGYSGKTIEKQLTKVDGLERDDLLQKQTKKNNTERVPLVLTYAKQLPNIHSILQKHMNILQRSSRMTEIFKSPPIVAYRRDKNLCDILVHGKTNKALKIATNDCTCKTCTCIHLGEVQSTDLSRSYRTVSDARCTYKNVVYVLLCIKCDKTIYVGETERSLKERIDEHIRDIRLQAEKPIMKHFVGHSVADVRVAVLQKVYTEGRIYRQLVEENWIKMLGTKVPQGCNIKLTI